MKLRLKLYTSIFLFVPYFFSACSKEEVPVFEPELGWFNGIIGKFGYNTLNSRTETFIETVRYKDGNYTFKFERQSLGYQYSHQRFVISLNNVLKKNSFQLFDPYTDEKTNTQDGIYFYTKTADVDGKNGDDRMYTTIKHKNSIFLNIDSVKNKELKTPSLTGKIKGYLYNIGNTKDSILIDVTFSTQASQ